MRRREKNDSTERIILSSILRLSSTICCDIDLKLSYRGFNAK